MFWFFTNLWAQEPQLGVFPVFTKDVSAEERAIIDRELFDASTERFAARMDIVPKEQIQTGLATLEFPEACSKGGCELLQAQMLGLDRIVLATVHRRKGTRIFRVALYDVDTHAIFSTQSAQLSKSDSFVGLSERVVRRLGDEPMLSDREAVETVASEGDVSPVSAVIEVVEGKNTKVVLIPAGTYALPGKQKEKIDSFLMMKSEVLQGQYEMIMRKKPSHFVRCGADCPVERVSWYDAIQFANALSTKHEFTQCYEISRAGISLRAECTGWRLPTELEWFYAASGGKEDHFAFSGSDSVDENAWYRGNASAQIHRVCQKKQSSFGLCDMSGNVWEWVWNTEVSEEGVDTAMRILRGGSWGNRAEKNRITARLAYKPTTRNYAIGFRLVRNR